MEKKKGMLKNVRSLDMIADDIYKLERKSIFDIGDLLIEAKAQCEHGEWMLWLEQFDWGWNTATRYADVAELGSKFCKLKNLRLAASTLYDLVGHDESDLPAIVEELAKHASKKQLSIDDAERLIQIGIGRRRFGDHPDATLMRLVALDEWSDESWHTEAVDALKERNPETDEDAESIIDEIAEAEREAERRAEETELLSRLETKSDGELDEAESIPDDDPLDRSLSPSLTRAEPRRPWAESHPFATAVRTLLDLHAKPLGRFAGMFSPADLRKVAEFLMDVEAAEVRAAAKPTEAVH